MEIQNSFKELEQKLENERKLEQKNDALIAKSDVELFIQQFNDYNANICKNESSLTIIKHDDNSMEQTKNNIVKYFENKTPNILKLDTLTIEKVYLPMIDLEYDWFYKTDHTKEVRTGTKYTTWSDGTTTERGIYETQHYTKDHSGHNTKQHFDKKFFPILITNRYTSEDIISNTEVDTTIKVLNNYGPNMVVGLQNAAWDTEKNATKWYYRSKISLIPLFFATITNTKGKKIEVFFQSKPLNYLKDLKLKTAKIENKKERTKQEKLNATLLFDMDDSEKLNHVFKNTPKSKIYPKKYLSLLSLSGLFFALAIIASFSISSSLSDVPLAPLGIICFASFVFPFPIFSFLTSIFYRSYPKTLVLIITAIIAIAIIIFAIVLLFIFPIHLGSFDSWT